MNEPAIFDVSVPLGAADVAVSEGAVDKQEIAGFPIEQGRKRMAELMNRHQPRDARACVPEREAIPCGPGASSSPRLEGKMGRPS